MKTYWYSINYTYHPILHQLYFKLSKYTPPSDGRIPAWQEDYDRENNLYCYIYTMGAICKCENCENVMSAVSKIKTRILQDASAYDIVFDKSFNELMYEEVVREYNIKLEEINELFD